MSKEKQETQNIRVQHFFPKGYNAQEEPYYSIVYACNHYERVKQQRLELLRGCKAAIAYLADPPSEFKSNRDEAIAIIRAAITKTEGQAV